MLDEDEDEEEHQKKLEEKRRLEAQQAAEQNTPEGKLKAEVFFVVLCTHFHFVSLARPGEPIYEHSQSSILWSCCRHCEISRSGRSGRGLLMLCLSPAIDKSLPRLQFGFPALIYAARDNFPKVVEALLAQGANVNATDKAGRSALHHAAQKSNHDVIQLLLNAPGVNVMLQDQAGNTPLHFSALSGDLRGAEMLVTKGSVQHCSVLQPDHVFSSRS